MSAQPEYLDAETWIGHVFGSQATPDGAVIRRTIRGVERFVGRDNTLHEMRRRRFSVIENSGQIVVYCNREPIRRITCSKKPSRTL